MRAGKIVEAQVRGDVSLLSRAILYLEVRISRLGSCVRLKNRNVYERNIARRYFISVDAASIAGSVNN